jgi:hypothetical protein
MTNKPLSEIRDELAKAICTIGPLQYDGFIRGWNACEQQLQPRVAALEAELSAIADIKTREKMLTYVALEKECARLREALERIAKDLDTGGDCLTCSYDGHLYKEHEPNCSYIVAREALSGREEGGEST